ncbi:signal recognition particle 19 kDa protein [mine drainage metagenome]|uniref:Signal recognition particle 19 kDa protein n=1 Tax=mine drainage metagenome TaxID=410659 RepID=T0ZJS6_9ZZZZ
MPDHFYVYPTYLARGSSRDVGRRVPAPLAIPDLTAAEIVGAAERLGYRAVLEADKHYPRTADLYLGRVKVTKRAGTTKAAFLRALATDLQQHRGPGGKR